MCKHTIQSMYLLGCQQSLFALCMKATGREYFSKNVNFMCFMYVLVLWAFLYCDIPCDCALSVWDSWMWDTSNNSYWPKPPPVSAFRAMLWPNKFTKGTNQGAEGTTTNEAINANRPADIQALKAPSCPPNSTLFSRTVMLIVTVYCWSQDSLVMNCSSSSNSGIPQIPKSCFLAPLSQGLHFDVLEGFGAI